MLETIKALTTEYDMLPRGGTVLCAVSGGADSMCRLHLLHTWAGEGGFRVAAAHYNHNLRGAESDLLLHDTAAQMTTRGPKARLVEVPDVGHAPTLMDAAQIAPIRDFLLEAR